MSHEIVSNVSRIVNTQTNCYYQVNTRYYVNCQPPEVDETSNIDLQMNILKDWLQINNVKRNDIINYDTTDHGEDDTD